MTAFIYILLLLLSWWHHQMETFSVLLALCERNPPVNSISPHKGQWCRALLFSLTCAWTNIWANNWYVSDVRCHHSHYDITYVKSQKQDIHRKATSLQISRRERFLVINLIKSGFLCSMSNPLNTLYKLPQKIMLHIHLKHPCNSHYSLEGKSSCESLL